MFVLWSFHAGPPIHTREACRARRGGSRGAEKGLLVGSVLGFPAGIFRRLTGNLVFTFLHGFSVSVLA